MSGLRSAQVVPWAGEVEEAEARDTIPSHGARRATGQQAPRVETAGASWTQQPTRYSGSGEDPETRRRTTEGERRRDDGKGGVMRGSPSFLRGLPSPGGGGGKAKGPGARGPDRKIQFFDSPSTVIRKDDTPVMGNNGWNTLRREYTLREPANLEEGEEEARCFRLWVVPVLQDQGTFVSVWDAMMVLCITYTALVVPFHAAFGEMRPWDGWLICHALLDGVFLLDMLLAVQHLVTVRSRKNIVLHYLHGSFAIDLASMVPLDFIVWSLQNGIQANGTLAARVTSLLRLLRLTRIRRVVQRVEASVPINYGVWTVLNFLLMTVVLAHWMACLWGLLAVFQLELRDDSNSWMLVEGEENGLQWDAAQHKFVPANPEPRPRVTDAERYFACGLMILGAYFLGYIVASLTSVVATRNADSSDYYRLMDQLGRFMDEHDLDRELRVKLRNYFHYRRQTRGMQSWHSIINQMSPNLRREVFAHTSCQLIQDIELFKDLDDGGGGFIMDLGTCLETNTYTPRESIVAIDDQALAMYIVRRGVVASEGSIFMRRGVFGLDMLEGLIRDEVPTRNYMAIALTYSDVLLINRTSLQKIWVLYPASQRNLRSRILRRILKQEIKAYTAAMTRIISGSRPYWSRLRGDPGGRETHYYNKLLTIIPRHDSFGAYLDMLLAASKIQRAFRHYMKIKRIQSTWRTPVAELRNLKRTETRAKTATTRPRRRSMETPQRGEGRMPVEASLSGSSLAACGAWADMLKELEGVKGEINGLRKERKGAISQTMSKRRSTVLQF
eukprot:jgi/Tetstr1/445761/TSEL_033409.t1